MLCELLTQNILVAYIYLFLIIVSYSKCNISLLSGSLEGLILPAAIYLKLMRNVDTEPDTIDDDDHDVEGMHTGEVTPSDFSPIFQAQEALTVTGTKMTTW